MVDSQYTAHYFHLGALYQTILSVVDVRCLGPLVRAVAAVALRYADGRCKLMGLRGSLAVLGRPIGDVFSQSC